MRSSIVYLFVGFFVSILLLIGVGIYWYSTFLNWKKANQVLEHNFEILQQTEDVLSLLKDIEAGERGYIITRDWSFFEPFQLARIELPKQLDHLDALMADTKTQQNRMNKLRLLVQKRIYYAKKAVNAALADPQVDPHLKVIYMRKGKETMDSMRLQVQELKHTELAKRPSLSLHKVKFALQSTIALVLSFGLSLALFIGTFYKMMQELFRRIKTEKQLERNLTALEQSNQHLDAFNYVTVHHLQEPLRKLNIFCDRLQQKYHDELPADVQFLVQKLNGSALEMRELIQDLTTYTALGKQSDPQEHVELELESIVEAVVEEYAEEIAEKNAYLDVEHPLPSIIGNPEQLRLLFTHLLTNSLKFSKPDVPLQIRITSSSASGRAIPGVLERDHDRSFQQINFSDNGIGIDKKYMHVIFELFQRLNKDKQIPGTGVGLTICKKIILNHDGYIAVRSEPNQGTTFMLFFPL
ncbi:sensor histidine kinase [Haliscomenobacter hydrossis]|uniref:histidine kinase n=1 Tax=Haliscomenobacter hydrossis (strain ATCC 27775 / DSM 1100 / LMG 10767 / O) TaxID=760192 RepID=F4L0M6_HALH1|nr:sensor histidine kinase [Haliscomenobacter hydrossis]AEE49508.1 integral membrane sensor signal transduction histidine kinase [Haliscomenobacter hydrossis DSM 1100]